MDLSRMTERLLRLAVSTHSVSEGYNPHCLCGGFLSQCLLTCFIFVHIDMSLSCIFTLLPPPGSKPSALADVFLLVLPLVSELHRWAAPLWWQRVLQRLVVCFVCAREEKCYSLQQEQIWTISLSSFSGAYSEAIVPGIDFLWQDQQFKDKLKQ